MSAKDLVEFYTRAMGYSSCEIAFLLREFQSAILNFFRLALLVYFSMENALNFTDYSKFSQKLV